MALDLDTMQLALAICGGVAALILPVYWGLYRVYGAVSATLTDISWLKDRVNNHETRILTVEHGLFSWIDACRCDPKDPARSRGPVHPMVPPEYLEHVRIELEQAEEG